ncbi:MAG: copper resistance protein B [Thermomonas haemolytica]
MRSLLLAPLLLWAGAAAAQSHEHHGHAMPTSPAASAPAEAADAHAGHEATGAHAAQHAGQIAQDPQADHALHGSHGDGADPIDPAAATPYRVPPVTAADRAAAFPILHGHPAHGDPLVWMVQADRFEYTQGDALAWSGKAWIGHDHGRLWLRSEGERTHGHTDASLEALWGRPLDAWWDVLAGLRHDNAGPGPERDWLALGVQGLAPYKFEVQATAYLGGGGRSMLRAEAEYELLLTNRLILQPRLEAVLNGRADPARGTGAGLAQTSQGVRLRYQIRRELAPYFGYAWTQRHGGSADRARLRGEPVRDHGWVAGVRFWL